ncbi:hypothetical protein GCWU000325_00309 [Alloprevotella tannerae ATCC 51259]|uniref:Uncharacterized protein n=1 Tax=Alloprevotella tannerae ATCC 51259 TaxID=626522 RepID=C9LDN6_9BACT|nr:hypothetical protein GCWU000325_00309 [Alloprevotella tannerae ATCC 51259]
MVEKTFFIITGPPYFDRQVGLSTTADTMRCDRIKGYLFR